MLLATMPRTLSPGEDIAIPVNVFAMDDNVRKVDVTIRGDKQISITGASSKPISFDKQGDQLVVFNAEVAQSVGVAKLTIEATSGREKTTTEIEIVVRNPNPVITEVAEFVVEKGKPWTGKVESIGMAGTNENTIEVSTLFPANLAERLRYLIQYPYGCLEQITSTAFPQLYVDQLIELSSEERKKTQYYVNSAIARITRFVNPSGGLSYWPGISEVHEWTNNYTGHFLVEAQRAGYYVNADILNHWKTYQAARTRQFDAQNRSSDELMTQAYRLYTLALAGSPEIGAMNRLRTSSKLTSTSQMMLAASYALIGQTDFAQTLLSSDSNVENYTTAGETFGSPTRDRALIVEALLACGKEDMAIAIVKRIADEMGSDRWYSTQTTAFALIAMSKFAKTQSSKELYFAIQANGQNKLTVRQPKLLYQRQLGAGDVSDLVVENLMDAPLYVRVIRTGQPLEPINKSVQSHLSARVLYQDMQGVQIKPESLKQGTDFVMSVTVANPGTLAGNINDIALQTLLPDGWELVNRRLDNLGDRFKNASSEYQDIRDDRVYTFFDLRSKESKTFHFALNAAYVGRYILPAVHCEGMYDHAVRATIPGGWVEVKDSGIKVAKASVSGD
jgi:uncharacterized protein YfaS (alpha-2-macroglobulin family)